MVHADSSGRTLDQTRRALWTPESTHTRLGCRVGCRAWNRQRRPSKRFRDISDIKFPFTPGWLTAGSSVRRCRDSSSGSRRWAVASRAKL